MLFTVGTYTEHKIITVCKKKKKSKCLENVFVVYQFDITQNLAAITSEQCFSLENKRGSFQIQMDALGELI